MYLLGDALSDNFEIKYRTNSENSVVKCPYPIQGSYNRIYVVYKFKNTKTNKTLYKEGEGRAIETGDVVNKSQMTSF